MRRIREEFVSGTRLGVLPSVPAVARGRHVGRDHDDAAFPDGAARKGAVRVRRYRSVRLLPDGALPEPGSIYELHYDATKPRVLGIGFAATRDLISHLRRHGDELMGRAVTHTVAFGISQAGRYLRDHIAQGFNADENGARVFDGVFTHVAGIGRVFHNTPFAQPFRTRTWHEDHDFPEVEFPFSAATQVDPISGASGALLRGDASDPKLIETNTSTEYWQKGASLLHTDPLGTQDVALPRERARLSAGRHAAWRQGEHAARQGALRQSAQLARSDAGDPRFAGGAGRVGGDGSRAARQPAAAHRRRHAGGGGGGCVAAGARPDPASRGERRGAAGGLDAAADAAARAWRALVPQVDADGNERAGIRLPDIAVPRGTFTGWNLYRAPIRRANSPTATARSWRSPRRRPGRRSTPDTRGTIR